MHKVKTTVKHSKTATKCRKKNAFIEWVYMCAREDECANKNMQKQEQVNGLS